MPRELVILDVRAVKDPGDQSGRISPLNQPGKLEPCRSDERRSPGWGVCPPPTGLRARLVRHALGSCSVPGSVWLFKIYLRFKILSRWRLLPLVGPRRTVPSRAEDRWDGDSAEKTSLLSGPASPLFAPTNPLPPPPPPPPSLGARGKGCSESHIENF